MSILHVHTRIAVVLATMMMAPQAFSHITLDTRQAPVGSSYKAVLRVPHGCKGSPTIKIRVQVPEGFIGIKPQPKAGWTLATVKGDYAKSYTLYGAQVSAGVKEITWSGGVLPDEYYDEFVFVGYLSDGLKPDTTLYFPVVQECEEGVSRWIDKPSGSPTADHAGSPAPGLKLLPGESRP